MPTDLTVLATGFVGATHALCIRLFPFFCVAIAGRSLRISGRVFAVAIYSALTLVTLWVGHGALLFWLALGLMYYGLATCGVYWLGRKLRAGSVTPGFVFVFSAVAFLVVPAIAVPHGPFLVLGWSLLLSSYSYCLDTRNRAEPTLAECAFFILVNPVLVFSMRGTRLAPQTSSLSGVVRGIAGLVIFCLAVVIGEPLTHNSTALANALGIGAFTPIVLPVSACLFFLVQYAQHSGLASLQIGLMREFGQAIPERYHYPFLARSPADFWRRWNTYVGAWALRYVFTPLALRLKRRASGSSAPLRAPDWASQGAAILTTFAVIGALHDGYSYAANFRFPILALEAFVLAGATMGIWTAVAMLGAARPFGREQSRAGVVDSVWAAGARRLTMVAMLVVFMRFWLAG